MNEFETLQILLVEDNPGDERLIREMLFGTKLGKFEIFNARNLADGIAQISKKDWDVALLDLSLPDSRGLDTFITFQKHSRVLPVIVLTGLDDDKVALAAVEHGAQDYLSKNAIDSAILERSINYAIKRKQLEEQVHLQATALQSAANAIFITNQEGLIEWVNSSFTAMTGYSSEEVLGQTPRILKSGQQKDNFYEGMWKAILAGQVWQSEVTNRRKDGSLITVEQVVTPFSGQNGHITHFVAIQQDITERVQAEQLKQDHIRELEALQKITFHLREAESLPDILATFLDHVLSALNLSAGEISLYDPKRNELHQMVSRGWFEFLETFPVSPDEGVSGWVYTSGETYCADEFGLSELVPASVREQIPAGWGGACVPLRSNKSIVGVLFVSSQLPRLITSQEVRLLELLANIAGSTIHRIKLLEDTRRDAMTLGVINEVGRVLSESLDLENIYDRLQKAIHGLIPGISTLIFSRFEHERELILPAYVQHDGLEQDISALQPIPLEPPGSGFQSRVIRTREPLISNNYRKELLKKVKHVQQVGTPGPIPNRHSLCRCWQKDE